MHFGLTRKPLRTLVTLSALALLAAPAWAQQAPATPAAQGDGKGILNLVIAIVLAIVSVLIDEVEEIGKGNVAVAVMVSGVLISVSMIVSEGVQSVSKILNVDNLWTNISAGF